MKAFIILPGLTISGGPVISSVGAVSAVVGIVNTSSIVSLEKQNIQTFDFIAQANIPASSPDPEVLAQKAKADAIDSYFIERDMPLAGQGMKMVLEAEKNNLDWRLLPAISVRESTGGKFACKKAKFSSFGWGSCKINFNSHEQEIEIIAQNLGGNNPKTAKHYDDKTTKQILRAYNPPSIVPRYAELVMSIMDAIGPEELAPTSQLVINS